MDLSTLILSMFQHGFKARYTTAYFVLIGKKTSSVLTYMQCYHLRGYYRLCPQLDRQQFEEIIQSFIQSGCLKSKDYWVEITHLGQQQLSMIDSKDLQTMDGWRYGKMIHQLWPTFVFTNQVLSELSHHEKHYRPIETNILLQRQLKQKLSQIHQPFHQWLQSYVEELLHFLSTIEDDAALLVDQLVGFQESGQTIQQLAQKYATTDWAIYIKTQWILEQLCRALESKQYPLLAYFYAIPDVLSKPVRYTQSLIQSQICDIEELSQRLHKRPGTVMDYLIELALTYPRQFPFDYYIGKWTSLLDQYASTDPNIGMWSYKSMKESMNEPLPFEAFRFYQLKRGLE